MLSNVSSSIFTDSKSIKMTPVVSAEWNQNIFNPPYATVAGTGNIQTNLTTSNTLSSVTGTSAKTGFTTKQYSMTADKNTITYNITPSDTSGAFKIITYIKTDKDYPIMANIYAKGSSGQFGSSSLEVNSFGWAKVETYIGGSSSSDTIGSFTYNIVLNRLNTEDSFPIQVLFTVPEVYSVSYFDYQYNSVWQTDSIFSNFRPGESYVNTGSSKFSFPTNFRKLEREILNGYSSDVYMPVSPIIQNPKLINIAPPVPFYKNGLLSDMNQYKYFVSDITNRSVTGLYDKSGVITNKLVLKFNTLMAVPTINIYVNDELISVDGSSSISLAANVSKEDGGIREDAGVLVLYRTASSWTRSRWSAMPKFNADGSVDKSVTLTKIRVTQVSNTVRSDFSSYDSASLDSDIDRMQLIEVSPRIEVDLTPYVLNFNINKSLDSKNTYLPISSINSDDASIVLSGIPLGTISSPVALFSSQSNKASLAMKKMYRKNIKLYINYSLDNYFDNSTKTLATPGTLIPGGIFYSDTWDESDVNEVSIQAYDIGRYLQSAQVSDYVSNLRTVIDVISNMLDLSGYTDYDYNSLYDVCNNRSVPVDLAFFYVNSKDTTIIDALNQIFLPYQIGAYIDEYGVMKFLSLTDVISKSVVDMSIDQSNILDNGYSVNNKAKPGKISLRYQSPKIKQSLSMQNLSLDANSPSFIYTTSNDIVWSQQNADSVGMNYLNTSMDETQNFFMLDKNDALDIFHTYNLNNNGYAFIENEIVSFVYKEYTLEDQSSNSATVYVKNDIELSGEIDRFNRKYTVGLPLSNGAYPAEFNTTITPTGKIANIQRGMFGTRVAPHTVLTSSNIASKEITCKNLTSSYAIFGSGTFSAASNNQFTPTTTTTGKVIFYPTSERSSAVTDSGTEPYKTYSTKFNFKDATEKVSGGLFFNMDNDEINANGAFFVELVRYNIQKPDLTWYSPQVYRYAMVVYRVNSGSPEILGYADVTSTVNEIINNFEKVLIKSGSGNSTTYAVSTDSRYASFNLRASFYKSTGEDGESSSVVDVLSVFLNNVEITGWQVLESGSWAPIALNSVTSLPKKVHLSGTVSADSIFGSFISTDPVAISGITYPSQSGTDAGGIREICGTHKSLIERSVNYYFQDREFLNGMVQNQNVFSRSKSYMMQTKPEVVGINTYDVQYTTPAAVSVDVWPIEYLLKYIPGPEVVDQQYVQQKEVNEYSLSYSTVLNTGFRAKFAIANNSSHMVFLKKDPTELLQGTSVLNLWTMEIIAPSDPEILEKVIDSANMSEVVQLDSNWIQSKESANKLVTTIARGIDIFSQDVSIDIFGNPLIQVGDVVELSYNLAGLKEQKYMVHSVSHSFSDGLSTKLVLNIIDQGISY